MEIRPVGSAYLDESEGTVTRSSFRKNPSIDRGCERLYRRGRTAPCNLLTWLP